MNGRVADATGLSSPTESASGLGPSGFDPSRDDDNYADGEGFFDHAGRWWPNNAEWCDRCQGMGTEDCECGGDSCVCGAHDSLTCRRCDGEGYWVPTPADLAAREANAKWWRELHAKLERDARDSDGSGAAGETVGLDPKGDSAGPKDIAHD